MEKVCVCDICYNLRGNMCNIHFIGIRDITHQHRDMGGYVYVLEYYLSDICSYTSMMTVYIRFGTFRVFAKSIMHNVTSPKPFRSQIMEGCRNIFENPLKASSCECAMIHHACERKNKRIQDVKFQV